MRNGRRCAVAVWLTILAGLFWFSSPAPTLAADKSSSPTAVDPFQQIKRLGRGVNVLGYDPSWKSKTKARFQAKHFALIRDAGFNHVRINLFPFRDTNAKDGSPIGDGYWQTLDWAVEQATANNLMVILDFHEFIEMATDPAAKKDRFLAAWKQIADRYKNAPSNVLFEILNEPNGKLTPELWNQMLVEALGAIRETNPTRTVIIGPGQWNSIDMLRKLELPEHDRNIIVTVHYYSPFEFTHQGTSWTNQKDTLGVTWEGNEQQRQAIERDFARAQTWATQHGRPLYLGEFGAYDKADMTSRARYIDCVARQAEKMNWSWAYWQFDSDFIAYDIANNRWVEPIRDALIPAR